MMDFGNVRLRTLTTCIAVALLAGCALRQAQGDIPMPMTGPPTANGSWVAPNTSGQDLIYMTLGSKIDEYTFKGQLAGVLDFGVVGTIQGLCSDTQGNVWVTYGDSLLEYTHGGTIPIAQMYTSGYPTSCAVDPTSGAIAVTQLSETSRNQQVAVFKEIYGVPQIYTDPDFFGYTYCTYDNKGDLFVNGFHGKKILLAELSSGDSSLKTVTVAQKFERIGGLEWDGEYLAMGDSLAHVIYQLNVAKGQATTVGTTHLKGWTGARFKTPEPFAIGDREIVLTFSDRQTGLWKYPAGGKALLRINVVSGDKTISIAPSALRRK